MFSKKAGFPSRDRLFSFALVLGRACFDTDWLFLNECPGNCVNACTSRTS